MDGLSTAKMAVDTRHTEQVTCQGNSIDYPQMCKVPSNAIAVVDLDVVCQRRLKWTSRRRAVSSGRGNAGDRRSQIVQWNSRSGLWHDPDLSVQW